MTRALDLAQDFLLGVLLFLAPIKLTTMVLGGEGVLAKQGLMISVALVGLAALAWLARQFLPQQQAEETDRGRRRKDKQRAPEAPAASPSRIRLPRTGLDLPAVVLFLLLVTSTVVASV